MNEKSALRRRSQYPLLLCAATLPGPLVCAAHFMPDQIWLALCFALAYVAAAEVCMLLSGKIRLIVGIVCAAAMAAAGYFFLPWGSALYLSLLLLLIPILYIVLLMLTIPMAAWPVTREISRRPSVIGIVLHCAAQVLVLQPPAYGQEYLYGGITGWLLGSFLLMLLLSFLLLNRESMLNADSGHGNASPAMRRKNTVLALIMFGIVVLISVIPSVIQAFVNAWNWLLDTIVDIGNALLGAVPTGTDFSKGTGMEGTSGGMMMDGAGLETSPLVVLLQNALMIMAGLICVTVAGILLYRLYKLVKAWIIRMWEQLSQYAANATGDYEDEVTTTRPEGVSERTRRAKTLRSLRLTDEAALSPGERIRLRYRRLLNRHKLWTNGQTARETLPDEAAVIYEQTRYSLHAPTAEQAETFKRVIKDL